MTPCPHPHPNCCLKCFDCPACCTCRYRLPWDVIERDLEKMLEGIRENDLHSENPCVKVYTVQANLPNMTSP